MLNPHQWPYNNCIEHIIHLSTCHFIHALGIPGVFKAKQHVQQAATSENVDQDENNENKERDEDENDIDMSMEVEVSEDDLDAICEASVTDFDVGDIVGKLMALVS